MKLLRFAAFAWLVGCAARPSTSDRVESGGWDDEKNATGAVAEASQLDAATSSSPSEPRDFAAEVRVLFRVVACAGSEPLPRNVSQAVVDAHCEELEPQIEAYRRRYVSVAQPFLAALPSSPPPKVVVYPFAGGDLATALTTYPEATDITTLSLELAGDPRRIRTMNGDALSQSLVKLRLELEELFVVDDYSKSETLKRTQRG
ncbi:MAG TPA: hypothetical protein VL400_20225, partial [Polyangiaceae bacterium]|nr:hypothetical protein [Polyangiaceae bacterium]